MMIHIEDMGQLPGNPQSICGKSPGMLWPDRVYPPTKNIKTIVNQMKRAGRKVQLCVLCTKFADLSILAGIDL